MTAILGRFPAAGFVVPEAAMLAEGLAEEELDLGVEGAQVVVGPFFQGVEHFGVDPQEE